ncbi:MAG: hypothetical protein R3C46_15635 [Hyphomonadaceae bacterium]
MKTLIAAALAATAMAVALPAAAQPGPQHGYPGGGSDVLHLQGLKVDHAKAQLASAGYNKARNINSGGRQYDLWSNARARESCVGFTSFNGTVTDVRSFSDAECGVVSGGWGQGGFRSSSLQGLWVDDAKRNLRNFSYTHERNIRIDGQQWDLWESSRGRDCIGFTSYNGRVTGTREFRQGECDGDWNSGGWGGGWIRPEQLRGLSVDDAKRELSRSGFDKARNVRIDGRQWDLWFDDRGRDGACIGFTSYNGRVTDARNFSARDCY